MALAVAVPEDEWVVEARPEPVPVPTRLPHWVIPLVVAAVFGGHLLLSRPLTGVFISDGTGYLANARWLAGRAGETFQGQTGFYHAGYSLFLAPVFRLFDDPATVYQGILVVNAGLAAASVLVYRALAARLGLGPRTALLAGLVAALYPAVLLQASVEWSENLYHLVFGVLLLAAHRLVFRRDPLAAAAVGALAVGLYATHPRGLGVLPVAGAAFAVLGWRRLVPWRTALTGLAVLAVTFIAVRLGHQVLIDAMWADDRPVTEGDVLSRLTEPSLLWGMVKRWFGQGWYILVGSAGLGAAGIAWLVDDGRRRGPDGAATFARITVLAMAATFAASAVMMSDGTRVDHLVYGRYDEGFLPALLVFGAAGLGRWRQPRQLGVLLATSSAAIVVLAAITVALNGGDRFTGQIAPLNVLGILVWELDRSTLDVLRVSAGAVAVAGVVVLSRFWSVRLALLGAGVFFLGSALLVRDEVLGPFFEQWSSRHELPVAVHELPYDGTVAFDRTAYTTPNANFYQFELLDRDVRFWSGRGRPPGEVVIGSRTGGRLPRLGGRVAAIEMSADYALWVLPGRLQDRLVAEGRLFPDDPAAPLPRAARRGRIDAPATLRTSQGDNPVVPVTITHTGTASPWAPLGALAAPRGAVRLQAVWSTGHSALAELPDVVGPGERVRLDLVLPVHPPPGRYEVRLVLVQDGVGTLAGETTLTVVVGR